MRRPRPLPGNNPGLRDVPTRNQARPNKKPLVVRGAEEVGHEAAHLAAMGHSAAKSAGHKAHDILHGIFG